MIKIGTVDIERRIKNYYKNNYDSILKMFFLIVIFVLGIIMRVKLFPIISGDMSGFLVPWYKYIQGHGGFACVGDHIGDYTPMYYYLMAIMTYVKLPIHEAIKWISIIFDVVMSIYVMKIVELNDKEKSFYPVIAFAVVFCLPTVVLNSSAWGQCDVIYTCFLVMSLYYILIGEDRFAMIMVGVSFSFKLQAVFVAPLICVLLMHKKIRWKMVLWIPIVYIMSIIPAIIAGGNVLRLLTVYFNQSGQYKWLSALLPNIWIFFGNKFINDAIGSSAVFFAAIIILCIIYYFVTRKRFVVTKKVLIGIAVIGAFIVPFVLPYMHERYMYYTEIMFVIFAFYYRKKAWLIATTQFCSIQGLLWYLYNVIPVDMRLLALLWIVNAGFAFNALKEELYTSISDDELKMKFEMNVSFSQLDEQDNITSENLLQDN